MDPLIAPDALLGRLGDADLRIVDARADLSDPAAGRRAYERAHLPGAVHLDLEEDLTGPLAHDGRGGRHPLPDPDAFAARLAAAGIGEGHEVVAYDDAGGAFAARVWWLLRWIGHERVRILDGGMAAWDRAGGPLDDALVAWPPADHAARPDRSALVDADEVARRLDDPTVRVVDARAPERYRGETEPIDPVAGHVPGAWNRPFAGSLDGDGRFLPPAALRDRLGGATQGRDAIVMCGSGVTAAHLALAMRVAGLPEPRLYAGSWSDWCSRPERPVATGDAEAGSERIAPGAHRARSDGA